MASQAPNASLKRLVIVGPSAFKMWRLRGGLIKAVIARGGSVLALVPDAPARDVEALRDLGAEVANVRLRSSGFSLFPRRGAAIALADVLRDWNPHTVLAIGAEAIPVAVMAARRGKSRHIAALVNEIAAGGLTKRVRTAVRTADSVIVHNAADEKVLRSLLAGTKVDLVRVAGAGADLKIEPGVAMPIVGSSLVFLALTRLDRVKGVHDYLEAARLARAKGIDARFLLAGADGIAAGAVRADTLNRYADCVTFLGGIEDPVTAIRQAHVFVSPSHIEGMPPDVLTALAAGRPVIATDIAGSRETVDENVNGTLVAPSDPSALASAFERMAANRAQLPAMARASRAKAERMFAADDVNAALLKALQLA